MLGDDAIISSDFGGNPPYEKMKEVAHDLLQATGSSNRTCCSSSAANRTTPTSSRPFARWPTRCASTLPSMGLSPLYVVVGRGGPNLVRGMGALRDTLEALWAAVSPLRLRLRHERGHQPRPRGRRLDEGWRTRRGRGEAPHSGGGSRLSRTVHIKTFSGG